MRAELRTPPAARPAALADRDDFGSVDTNLLPWPGRHHLVDGHDVFVRATPSTAGAQAGAGSGATPGPEPEPALYVHGLGGASTNFTDLADLLSPWLDGQAIDLPGFGRSGPSTRGRYSIAAHADVVESYLDQSGRGPVHLVGNSMGGAISIALAARRPDLVRTLTLISPAVPDLRPKRGEDVLLPLLMLPVVGPRMLARTEAADPQARARAIIELCFAHPELVPENRRAEAAAEFTARQSVPWAQAAFLGSLRGIAGNYLSQRSRSPWRSMAAITAPSLVIWGELDRLVDAAKAPRVAATIPDATLLVLPDVGHTAQLEDPLITARAVIGLISRANQARASSGVQS